MPLDHGRSDRAPGDNEWQRKIPYPAIAAGPAHGPLVLLLHGFPQTKEAWRRVVPPLADAGHRVVAFDQRGYRPSCLDDRGGCALPEVASDVLRVADALGYERFHVVGHDWGGAVVWRLAAAEPSRLISATSVATPHPRAYLRSLAGPQALRSTYIAAFKAPLLPEILLGAGGAKGIRRLLTASGLDAAHADEYSRAMQVPGVLRGALGWYRSNGWRVLSEVGPARVPTLYVWPSGDVALGRAAALRTSDHVQAPYRFEEVEGCPHWMPELRPRRLADLVLDHLRRADARPAPAGTGG